MKVLSIQMGAGPDKEDNIKRAAELIKKAQTNCGRFDLICLPELFYSLTGPDPKREYAETAEKFCRIVSPIAREAESYLVAGSFAELAENGRIYNTSMAFDRQGNLLGSYRKIHLFDALKRKESELLSPGDALFTFDTGFGKCGVLICYDLRFPDLWLELAALDVKVIALPAAFYSPRDDHWEVLNRAMALTTQSYVVASNQTGARTDKNRVFCGRSMIVDPWGVIQAAASDIEGYCAADLDFGYLEDIRQRLPLRKG